MAVSASVLALLVSAVLLLLASPSAAARKHHRGTQGMARDYCREGMFDDRLHGAKNGTLNCRPCSYCLPGYGVSRLCTRYNDTECLPCPAGQYSATTSRLDDCMACRECQTHRPTSRACTTSTDTVCSSDCVHGYFYSVLDEACLLCSKCYHDPEYEQTSLRVDKCQQAGIDPSMQCWPLPTRLTDNDVASNIAVASGSDVHRARSTESPGPGSQGTGDDGVPLDESTVQAYRVIVVVLISVTGLCAVLSTGIMIAFCHVMRKLDGQRTGTVSRNGYRRISKETSKILVRGSTYV